jgi:hypothetical protein
MPQYLVAIHHRDDYDPSVAEDEAMPRDIDLLNEEMQAAGARNFAGGLHPASSARSLWAQPDCEVLITDGPYLETKEHIWMADTHRSHVDGSHCAKKLGKGGSSQM